MYSQAGVLCTDSITTMFLVPSCKLAINLGKSVAFNIHASAILVVFDNCTSRSWKDYNYNFVVQGVTVSFKAMIVNP